MSDENNISTQVLDFYRGQGKYYTEIVRTMADELFSWAFTLNTGALAVTIAFMGASVKWGNTDCKELLLFMILIIMFSLGILAIVLAAHWEQKRFIEKGILLDNDFYDYRSGNLKLKEFINKFPYKVDFYDKASPFAQIASYMIFFLGILIGFILIYSKV